MAQVHGIDLNKLYLVNHDLDGDIRTLETKNHIPTTVARGKW